MLAEIVILQFWSRRNFQLKPLPGCSVNKVISAMSPLNYYNLISELRPDDDFINNSESDISVASEIYPLLSNVSLGQDNYIVCKAIRFYKSM